MMHESYCYIVSLGRNELRQEYVTTLTVIRPIQ